MPLSALAILLLATGATAQVALESVQPLHVNFRGATLIEGWYMKPPPGEVQTRQVEVEGWDQVHRRRATAPGSKMRQEVAVRPDGLEITHLRLLEPDVVGVTSCGVVLPLELLDGARFECIGSPRGEAQRGGRTWSGTLGQQGIRVIRELQYLRLHLPQGTVDLDCNPKGAWCPGEGLCPAVERFALARSEEGWRLWSADGKIRRGGLHEFKLVVTPAREAPVAEVHPPVNTRWTQPYAPTARINFGGELEGYVSSRPAGAEVTSDPRLGWMRPERVEGVVGEGELVLRIPVERNGVYLVSLLVGDPGEDIAGCFVDAGVGEAREMPAVAAGRFGSWAVPGRATEGEITVTVSGWRVRVVAAQAAPMMFANEDYHLQRGWWVAGELQESSGLNDLPW